MIGMITAFVNRIRRNHGLEHATIHVLSEKHRPPSVVGHSDWNGFTLYGPLSTAQIEAAAEEALARLRKGESYLAVHPRCGTVLATIGFMTGVASFLAVGFDSSSQRTRFRWTALPAAILAATLAAVFATPTGMFIQANYTVSGQPANLAIKRVRLVSNGRMVVHRVETVQ